MRVAVRFFLPIPASGGWSCWWSACPQQAHLPMGVGLGSWLNTHTNFFESRINHNNNNGGKRWVGWNMAASPVFGPSPTKAWVGLGTKNTENRTFKKLEKLKKIHKKTEPPIFTPTSAHLDTR